MTSFSSIFKELTKSKLRLVRRLAFLQIVVGVLFGFWALLRMAFQGESKSYMLTAFITITPLFDLAYLFLSSRKNEQVYASQTWRLAPIKNSALLFANLGSAIIDGIFLVILQIVMIIIAGLPVIITNEFWQTTFKNFGSIGEGKLWQDIHLADSLTCIGLIFLMNVYWFVMNSLTGFLQNGMFLTTLSKDAIDVRSNLTENYLTMAVVLVVDIILIIVNIFLLNKYHEAKI